jgi:hypothetical protein
MWVEKEVKDMLSELVVDSKGGFWALQLRIDSEPRRHSPEDGISLVGDESVGEWRVVQSDSQDGSLISSS